MYMYKLIVTISMMSSSDQIEKHGKGAEIKEQDGAAQWVSEYRVWLSIQL